MPQRRSPLHPPAQVAQVTGPGAPQAPRLLVGARLPRRRPAGRPGLRTSAARMGALPRRPLPVSKGIVDRGAGPATAPPLSVLAPGSSPMPCSRPLRPAPAAPMRGGGGRDWRDMDCRAAQCGPTQRNATAAPRARRATETEDEAIPLPPARALARTTRRCPKSCGTTPSTAFRGR